MEGIGKEDKSKIGTMIGSPRQLHQKIAIDFNSDLFEHIPPIDDGESSSSSEDSDDIEEDKELSSDSGIDDSDYDEMEFQEDGNSSYPRFVNFKSRYQVDQPETEKSEEEEEEEEKTARSSFWEENMETSIRDLQSKSESKIDIEITPDLSYAHDEEDMLTENDAAAALDMQFDRYN